MRDEAFDRLARALGGSGSRRSVARGIGVTALLLVAGGRGLAVAGKKRKKRKKKDKKKRCRPMSQERVIAIIKEAARRYNQSERAMIRVAQCESNLDPCAVNRQGRSYGLFQFIESTWKSTPYGNQNIFDARANAMAAGWMWKEGRRNEWVCQ